MKENYFLTKGGIVALLIIGISFFFVSCFDAITGNEEDDYIWGFRNIYDKVVIAPKFDSVKPFKYGLAPVRKADEGWGYIDQSGAIVIDLQFDEAGPFTADGLAWVIGKGQSKLKLRDRNVSFIDRDGNTVISVEGIEAYSFYKGVAIVKQYIGEKNIGSNTSNYQRIYSYGLIDREGNFLLPHIEDIDDPQRIGWARQFKEGLARIGREAGAGYMNTKGKTVISCQFRNAEDFSNGLAAVRGKEKGARWSFIDRKGKVCLSELAPETYFQPRGMFDGGLAPVRIIQPNSSGLMYIKKNGRPAFSTRGMKLKYLSNYSAGLAAVTVGIDDHLGKVGFVDKDGAMAIEPMYLEAGAFHTRGGKVAWAVPWTSYGYLDAIDDLVFSFLGMFEKKSKMKLGYIDRKGDWLIQPETPFVERIRVSKDRRGSTTQTYNFSEGLAAFPSRR